MLLHCDLVYASEGAHFHTPFTDLALVPEAASSLLMPRLMGHQRAAQLLLAAERVTAQQAFEFGMVTHLCAPDALGATAQAAADALAQKAPQALQLTKRLMKGATIRLLSI